MARKPKYRKHTARNRGFVEFNGKRHYLPGPYKSPESMAAYRKFLRENLREEVREPASGKVYVGEIAIRFRQWADDNYPPDARSEAANCRAAIKHLSPDDIECEAIAFGPTRLKDLMGRMARGKATRTYINAVSARIKRMFKWAASEELVPGQVYYALATVGGLRKGRSPAVEPKKKTIIQWEWIEPVLAELSPTVCAMVRLHWLTGARSQSICQARAGQFTKPEDEKKGGIWEWRPRHKTEDTHDVVLFVGPQGQEILEPILEGKSPTEFLFQPRHQNGKRAKGFRSFYDSVSYLRAITRALARVNAKLVELAKQPIPYWTPHQLRHSRATLIRAEFGLEAAQASLGHATLDATQIYAQKQVALARLVAERMG